MTFQSLPDRVVLRRDVKLVDASPAEVRTESVSKEAYILVSGLINLVGLCRLQIQLMSTPRAANAAQEIFPTQVLR